MIATLLLGAILAQPDPAEASALAEQNRVFELAKAACPMYGRLIEAHENTDEYIGFIVEREHLSRVQKVLLLQFCYMISTGRLEAAREELARARAATRR